MTVSQSKAVVRFAAMVEDQQAAFGRLYPDSTGYRPQDIEKLDPPQLIVAWLALTDAIQAGLDDIVQPPPEAAPPPAPAAQPKL